jgi:hypothetical protein
MATLARLSHVGFNVPRDCFDAVHQDGHAAAGIGEPDISETLATWVLI